MKLTIGGVLAAAAVVLAVLFFQSDPKDAFLREQVRAGRYLSAKQYGRRGDACARVEGVEPHQEPDYSKIPGMENYKVDYRVPKAWHFTGTICCNDSADCEIDATNGGYVY